MQDKEVSSVTKSLPNYFRKRVNTYYLTTYIFFSNLATNIEKKFY